MPTYCVSVSISRPAVLNDEALIRVFHGAAERAAYVPIEVTPAGLVIEAEAASLATLEETLREEMQNIGGQVERFSVRASEW
jgi:hypothetical protein